MMHSIQQLNEKFAIDGKIHFREGNGDFPLITVSNSHAFAIVSVYGAQLLSYIRCGERDLIWMSDQSVFAHGKAIRGGIPICFPWFGPHPTEKSFPQHGFARLTTWEVDDISQTNDDSTVIQFSMKESADTLPLWPHQFKAAVTIFIGKTIDVKLTVTNTDNAAFEYSDALHTYFNINDIKSTVIEGLQDEMYYEGFDTTLQTQKEALLSFSSETNRRYVNSLSRCIIHDKGYFRKIKVDKGGSKVTVVWNPGAAVTKTMSDMHPDGYLKFVCVEPANAYPGIDTITLNPGESHSISTSIDIIV